MFLQSLEEWNKKRCEMYKIVQYSKLNNLLCPKCNAQLSDVSDKILLNYPPQKDVICFTCGYKGYRIV